MLIYTKSEQSSSKLIDNEYTINNSSKGDEQTSNDRQSNKEDSIGSLDAYLSNPKATKNIDIEKGHYKHQKASLKSKSKKSTLLEPLVANSDKRQNKFQRIVKSEYTNDKQHYSKFSMSLPPLLGQKSTLKVSL